MARKSKLLEELGKSMKDINLENELEDLDIDVLKDITIHIKGVTDYRADIRKCDNDYTFSNYG